jgi:hypothetical protein
MDAHAHKYILQKRSYGSHCKDSKPNWAEIQETSISKRPCMIPRQLFFLHPLRDEGIVGFGEEVLCVVPLKRKLWPLLIQNVILEVEALTSLGHLGVIIQCLWCICLDRPSVFSPFH